MSYCYVCFTARVRSRMRESQRRLASDSQLQMSGQLRAARRAASVVVLLLDGTELQIQLNVSDTSLS